MFCGNDNVIENTSFYLTSQVNSCYQFSFLLKEKDKVCQCTGTLCGFSLSRNSYCLKLQRSPPTPIIQVHLEILTGMSLHVTTCLGNFPLQHSTLPHSHNKM